MSVPEKEITIYDIARALDLSPATVSRALANHAAISIKTKKRIQEAAQAMGYRTNRMASNLRKKRSNIIGVIVPRLNSSFMSDVLAGMEKVLNQAGYNIIISQSFETAAKEITNAQAMYNNRVDGLLVSLAYESHHTNHFDAFTQRNIPIVYFDRVLKDDHNPGVMIDNVKAAYAITEHLIKQGCRQIVHVTAQHLHSVYKQRLEGFKQALLDNSMPFSYDMVLGSDLTLSGSTEIADLVMNLPTQPDGIFAANDACAVNCIMGLKEKGISVPHDIAVAGFNNDPVACISEPKLTTVNYDGYAMGEASARVLLKRLNNQYDATTDKEVILPAELIIRGSTLRNK
ncbi:LacI family DNA-binding transcriptional regulator [Mucilaginibacter sp. Bleaf8]|uniref:LacI family DNA-binding transcriptional regulator n=1 Tax=Mucilaginibacter sp. Bleaf8 TaxID=2834430 RepID=UPI001BD04E5E|nr:LacI family DNA-binding transcriptional regulator [Mucilaginibacter sp. Bleaf8]MBS7563665.1 LacI family DNA-binding transcriptional regulator [Mucilaginibacter sp. Bleaf8]